MDSFRERRQLDKLALYQHLWACLLIGVLASTFTMLSEVFTVAKFSKLEDWARDDGTWKQEWIAGVGAPHGIFLAVLAILMYLLAPFKGKLMGSAVALEGGQERKGDVDDVFAERDDDQEDASFWAGGQKAGKRYCGCRRRG